MRRAAPYSPSRIRPAARRSVPRGALRGAAVILTLLCLPGAVRAQEAPRGSPGTAESYLTEAAGGALGSVAGFGIGIALARPDECNSEDLGCILNGVAVALVGSAAGAGVGAWSAGRWRDTEPSGWGAAIGAVAGAAGGVGVIKLIEEIDPGGAEGVGAIAIYGLTHGLVTALFTRVF